MTEKEKPKKNQEKKRIQIKHFFYKSEDLIPYNLLHKWFKEEELVRVNLRTKDIKGIQFHVIGKIACVEQYHVVILNASEKPRIIFKHDISSIRLENEEEKEDGK